MPRVIMIAAVTVLAACSSGRSEPAATTTTTSFTTTTSTTLAAMTPPETGASGLPGGESPDPSASASAGPLGEVQAQASPSPASDVSPNPDTATSPADRLLRQQVQLDRAHFSPGEIDGRDGTNTRLALAAYAKARGGAAALDADATPPLAAYTIAPADVAGPFTRLPADMEEKAKLPALGYSSALEGLGEKFHCKPDLLKRLNPGAAFRAGEPIQVPAVTRTPPGKAAKVVVDKSDMSVTALDAQGRVLARYPATMGSEHDPLPLGTWKITGVQRNPTFFYNPDLFWDAKGEHSKAKIAAGPNSPVGVVWIDLSKEHYGIHGTPEPGAIGKTESHGCIRLTNWDVLELADMVGPGTPAILQE